MNKLWILAAGMLSFAVSVRAGDVKEYPKDSSPEIFQKNYEGMHFFERDYQIGRSRLIVTAACQETAAAAEKAIALKVASLQTTIDATILRLGLGAKSEVLGYNLSRETEVTKRNPIEPPNNSNKYKWTNTCTGKADSAPVRAENIYDGTKEISIWFPNTGTTLSDLTVLTRKLEDLSDSATDGVKVSCINEDGENFKLDVTEATKKAAWAEIERVAMEQAQDMKARDFKDQSYDQAWHVREQFYPEQEALLPRPVRIAKENGKWTARFSEPRSFGVFFRQNSEKPLKEGVLSDTRVFSVVAEAEESNGLYGTLTVVVEKKCMPTQRAAEEAVTAIANEIAEKELKPINDGQNSITDRLKLAEARGSEQDSIETYQQLAADGREITHYYDTCTMKAYKTERPKLKVFSARQQLTIRSRNLDALTLLRTRLNEKYAVKSSDPNLLTVSVAEPELAVRLDILQTVGSQLQEKAARKFLAHKGEYQCESGKYSFACLTSPRMNRQFGFGDASGSLESAAPQRKSYSDSAGMPVAAGDRGAKKFVGKYVITYMLRRVLK